MKVDIIGIPIDLGADRRGVDMDPRHAPGVGTPVPAGLTQREAHLACEMIAETGRLAGMDIVEVNPILDVQNQTAALGVEYVLSTLGQRIWNGD